MHETRPGNEERKLQCDIGFVWSEPQRNCMASVGKKTAYQRNLPFYKFPCFERYKFPHLSVMLYYAGTHVEHVTAETEVPYEIIYIRTCSTPLCSPVKSAGYYKDDDNKDQDYIPTNLFSAKVIEEEEEKMKKGQKTEENERYIKVLSQLTFFQFVPWGYFLLCYRIICSKNVLCPQGVRSSSLSLSSVLCAPSLLQLKCFVLLLL